MKSSTKYLKILTNYLLMALSLFTVFYVVPKLLVFFSPFVVAAVIAAITSPLVKFLEKRIKIKRKAGTVIVIILALALVAFASYLLISFIVSEVSGLAETLPNVWESINSTFKSASENYSGYLHGLPPAVRDWFDSVNEGVSGSLSAWVSTLGEKTAEAASETLKNIPLTIICIIMCILASYLFVAERDYINKKALAFFGPNTANRWNIVMDSMKSAVGGYFKAQLKIEVFVYAVTFVGLLVLGIKYSFLIALLIAFLDFLPVFGAGAVMIPWAIIAFMQENYPIAVGMLIVWAIGQVVRQLIQPKMVGDSVGLPPVPTLILLFVGFRIGGAVGLIIAIPVGMIIFNLYKAGLFSNFVYSTQIMVKDISEFRKFSPEELELEGIKIDSEEDGEEKAEAKTEGKIREKTEE